ncbi:MAG: SOS response-associated peptidase [Betaproteobacteria bacterium]|nr:SOS response-associated peptidase [Betaproteobacteria bacterium]
MCGRYALHSSPEVIALQFGLQSTPSWPPRYNIAPTQLAPIVRISPKGKREMAIARWGLIPSWAKDMAMGAKMNNARAETVAEKPAFRAAFRRRRCLIPVDGWYEWKEEGGRKQPYFLYLRERGLAGLAGLWEEWISPDGSPIESYAVVTTDANAEAAKIHDRMPVIVAPAQQSLWLEGEPRQASSLLRALEPGGLRFHKVDRRMSAARVADAMCVETVSDEESSAPDIAASERQGRLL